MSCPFPIKGDDGTIKQCIERGHCGCDESKKVTMPDVIKSLDNAYDHIQHEAYNDALSSILEARSKYILERSQPKVDELLEANKKLSKGIEAVRALMNESYGVDGLHLNGDIAAWDELVEFGRFEEWLIDFNEAEKYAKIGDKCEHGKLINDYCEPCGRINGGG